MMTNFVKQMRDRIDRMTEDQIIYLLLPEMLHFKGVAEEAGDKDRLDDCQQVLDYIKQKVELDNFQVTDVFGNAKFKVPSPSEIVNKKSPSDVPNN